MCWLLDIFKGNVCTRHAFYFYLKLLPHEFSFKTKIFSGSFEHIAMHRLAQTVSILEYTLN